MSVDKNKIDTVQVWNTFLLFNGDVPRTAATVELPEKIVAELAESENWKAKLAGLSNIKTNAKDLATQINRAVIFTHANRLRNMLGKLIKDMSEDPDTLDSYLSVPTKNGSMKSIKPLLDLAKALESTSILTQRALGDTESERPQRGDKDPEDLGMITSKTLEALAQAAGTGDYIDAPKTPAKEK